jgi:3-methyladenine DNA glycosylase AlkD
MKLPEVMRQLKSMGNAKTRATLQRHGAPSDIYGVRIGDLQKIARKLKKDQPLAEELFATGNGDAMYLAGLIADPQAIKPSVLRRWARSSSWAMVSEYAVAGVAAESPQGWKLGLEWIEAKKEDVACTGWNTLVGVISITPDDDLDIHKVESLLARVQKEIHKAPNRVRYTMNNFVIAVGCYVIPMSQKARAAAKAIGRVEVDMGDTACKVPFAPETIDKVVKMGRLGKKRKKARC